MKGFYTVVLLVLILCLNIVTFVGIFLNVFQHLNSLSSNVVHSESAPLKSSAKPDINRVIFFVLDAFRTSFVISHGHCLPNILKHGGLVFNVRTFTPTVTSPRIKTLTTGTVPEFADVFFNLQSSEVQTDSLLNQWFLVNKSIVFYGDDTWLKLFNRKLFKRHLEVSSFYAVDFTEVDNAVSNPVLSYELGMHDWDVLILHYLGLDHIGHSRGPDGELVCSKLKEMDSIFDKLIEAVISTNPGSLLAIMGDHGMSNEGSHGGSTDDELYTPLFLVSSVFKKPYSTEYLSNMNEISQVDISTSLALLSGANIPASSLGLIPEHVISFLSKEKQDSLIRQNFEHLLNLCDDCGPYTNYDNINVLNNYEEMKRLQSILLSRHSSVSRLHLSIIVSTMALTIFSIHCIISEGVKTISLRITSTSMILSLIFSGFLSAFLTFSSSDSYLAVFILPMFLPVYVLLSFEFNASNFILFVAAQFPIIFLNIAVLFSSSFVEEEHFFWYFSCQALISYRIYQRLRVYAVINDSEISHLWTLPGIAVCVRICKAYIYPGVKWADEGLDYVHYIRGEGQFLQTPIFIFANIFAFFILLRILMQNFSHKVILTLAFFFNFLLIFCYKIVRGDLKMALFSNDEDDNVSASDALSATPYAQASFLLLITVILVSRLKLSEKQLVPIFLPFFFQLGCLLLRCYLVIPLLLLLIISELLHIYLKSSPVFDIQLVIALSRMAFFALENSNRLATIDVGAAYVGLTDHYPLLSGCLLFLATSFGPLFIFISSSTTTFQPLCIIYQGIIFVFCASCITLLANHLFVWSVFAPKLLYEVFWTLLVILVFMVSGKT